MALCGRHINEPLYLKLQVASRQSTIAQVWPQYFMNFGIGILAPFVNLL